MREIKFRAWSRCGEWDEAGEKQAFKMIDADDLGFEDYEPLADLLKDVEDEFYLMQYTGLKDKDGKEIYEGDILDAEDRIVLVRWQDDLGIWDTDWIRYKNQRTSNGISNAEWKFRAKIIGNIYETPELLNP